jgi:hypothetical protein
MAVRTRKSHPKGRKKQDGRTNTLASDLLRAHFGNVSLTDLRVSERKFPFRVRADLQRSVDRILGAGAGVRHFCGVHAPYAHEGIDLAALMVNERNYPPVVVPPHYDEIDIGEEQPVRSLRTGLWLLERGGRRYAVLLSPQVQYGRATGVRFQVATADTAEGVTIADAFFRALESAVHDARSYRSKILSLEQDDTYTGQSTGIRVHKLHAVAREQVILPRRTLDLLDRNVVRFVQRREGLRALGQATKKGLLFYGPPGTGKSHTIHYLAGALAGHTTLLVTAEQVGLLGEYMALARLLQPSVVVIEDVDLIARDREQMSSPCEEALLNKLLNEMDGLRESADILFILTTNRPQALEVALASRPGRVDQAIEFPLPDDDGREKLVRLYARGAAIADDVVRAVVARTENVSAAFIKELMRRSVQFRLERAGGAGGAGAGGEAAIDLPDVEAALDEMLFSGGSLNVRLLGGHADATSLPGTATGN